MNPLSDEVLILHYYGEAPDAAAVERRLAEDPADRARFEALSHLLDAVPTPEEPELPPEYGAQVWARVAPLLTGRRVAPAGRRSPHPGRRLGWRWLLAPRWGSQWGLATAALVLVMVAFFAGRYLPREATESWTVSEDGRERILRSAVSGHLERTEMLLLELTNNRNRGSVDLSAERSLAGELSSEGRLYREAARAAGEADLASLLDEIERLLIDLSHGPDTLSPQALDQLQARLAERDLLFRLRVVDARLQRETDDGRPAATTPRIPTT
jgi:hypothetical protein